MRRRKAGAGSMATTSCPSSFKVSGSPTGSKSSPTPRPRNPKPPPPDASGHHQDSAIAHRQDLPRGDHESPGCIKRERIVASKKVAPRAEPTSEGRRQHEQPNTDRYGCSPRRGGSDGTVTRIC